MNDADSIQILQQRMDHLEMRMKALSVKEVKPTKQDLHDIRQARKDIAAGKVIPSKVKEHTGDQNGHFYVELTHRAEKNINWNPN